MFARKLFAMAALAQIGSSVRVSDETEDLALSVEEFESQIGQQDQALPLVKSPSDICGGSKIWDVITWAQTDPDGTQEGMQKAVALDASWTRIEGLKTQFMEMQAKEKTRVEGELVDLKKKLKAERATEGIGKTDSSQHKQLVELAFNFGEGSYGGTAEAYKWKCGAIRRLEGKRPSATIRNADEVTKDKFKELAQGFFSKNRMIFDEKVFLKECKSAVMNEDSEEDNFCGDICQSMTKDGKKESNKISPTNLGNSDVVEGKISEAETELKKLTMSMEDCENDFKTLAGFKDETKSLSTHYQKCGANFRKARRDLRDVKKSAEALEKDLAEQEEKLKDATDKLKKSQGDTKDAVAALEDAKKKDGNLKAEIMGLVLSITGMEQNLQTAHGANAKIGDLQAKVTDTMMKMVNWAKEGIREPLENLGFTPDPADLELNDPATITGASNLRSSLESMSEFCQEKAMPAFESIKEELDLTPLCAFDSAQSMFQDLSAAVTQRYASMKTDMLMAVDWLNPCKMTKMPKAADGDLQEQCDAVEKKKGEKGQLKGLEQVKPFYMGPPNVFFPYLIGWREDGPHVKLIAELEDHIEKLTKVRDEAKQKLEASKAASKEASAAREAAAKKLKEAQAKQADKADLKAAVEKAVAILEEEGKKLTEDISAFEAKFKAAEAALQKAKEALTAAYDNATK